MKNFLFLFICVITLQSLKAQTAGASPVIDNDSHQKNIKELFVVNKDYMRPDSKTTRAFTSEDSLVGFDEAAMRQDMINNNVVGQEAVNYERVLKRYFIYHKYKIGAIYANKAVANTPSPTSKNIGGPSVINAIPCVNEDFELNVAGPYFGAANATAISGWTVTSGQNFCTLSTSVGMPTSWVSGSQELWVRQTPVLGVPYIGTIPNSPLGGTKIIQMQDQSANGLCTKIAQTFPVTANNTLFQFAVAGAYQDGTHNCCEQPFLKIRMFDCQGAPLSCSSLSLNPTGANCVSGSPGFTTTAGVSWSNWQVRYIDLTPFIGTCVTIEIINSDCSPTGHWGTTYFDARCGGQIACPTCTLPTPGPSTLVPSVNSFCAGSNQAMIAGPLGYQSYSWTAVSPAAPLPSSQATLSTVTIANPMPGSVYILNMISQSGCPFVMTNTLNYTQVNIVGIGSTSTCIGGSSGSSTVIGNGSGTGYNYTWINSSNNAIVGTNSVATGLAPGVYSIVLTGFGAAGCGSAVATTTITTGPPGIVEVLKPFCGGEAYLGVTGGSNYHWYNGNTPIPPPLGAASGYTVTSPGNMSVYWLSYLSQYGCQDSVKYTLVASTPGLIAPPIVSWICPGGTNGTAIINMSPAPGAPPGLNSFSVFATGPTTPTYNTFVYPYASNSYTATGLAAGTYSVKAFDGSCKYGTTFNVAPFTYNWGVTPTSATLCPGQSVAASLTFPSPPSQAQYTYSWSPNVFLAGNANTYSSTIITPNIPVGTNLTTTYVIVVTPSLVFCPTSKTITITAVNPPIPTITPISNLCNSFGPYQILVNPTGGTFNSGITGTANPIGNLTGIITPSLANIGSNNNVIYMIAVGNCSASSSTTYEVSQFRTAALTSSVPPQCVTNAPFNLMNIVQSAAGGTWTGQGVQGTTYNASLLNGNIFSPPLYTNNYTITYSTTSTPNPNTCPHSSQLSVAVTKTMTPNITPVPAFCTNGTAFNMTVSPTGGNWVTTNNPAISASGSVNPLFAPVPASIGTYTIGIGPCINTSTTTLTTSTFYPAGFSGTVNNLCVTSLPVNLMGIVQSTTGNWVSSPGVQSNSFVPSSLASFTNITADIYVLTYTVPSSPNPTLCPDSRTIAVSMLNPPAPNISNLGPLCSIFAPVQLTVAPALGYWISSGYLSNTGVFTPSLGSIGNNVVQYAIGTPTCNTQQSKFISVEAFVSAKITAQLPDQCNNGPIVNLAPFSGSGLGTWIGAGVTGSSFNPGMTGSGSFTLQHKTASAPSGLCPDEDAMAVNVYSLATPQLGKIGPYCNNALPVQIPVSPVGGIFGGAAMGAVSLEGKFNPGSAILGDNVINYSITSGPCIAYGQSTITVEKFVSAAFDRSVSAICLIPGKTEAINMNAYVQNPGMFWEGAGIIAGTSMFDPKLVKPGKNHKVTYYTHSMPTATLCPDKTEILIEVRDMPAMKAIGTGGGCLPAEIVFNTPDAPSQVGVGTWNFDDGSEPQQGLYVTHVYTVAGTYNATFTYKDDIGCEAKPVQVNPVKVHNTPKADFTVPEEIYISNPEVQFTNLTTVLGDNTYQWKIANLYTMDDVNPVVNFPKIGKYQVTLIATSPVAAGGCTDQVTRTIEIKNDFNIYIPSSFSPNFDGLNDIFIPVFSEYGLDTKSFEMEIFDRWGHSIYRTKDVTKGWDGSVNNKGEPLKEEVYIYRIKYKDLDGNSYSKMGHLTLLK